MTHGRNRYDKTQSKPDILTKSYILIKEKVFESWWSALFLPKTFFPILNVAHNDPFSVQIGPKKQFLRGFTNFFSELLDYNASYKY